jgi:hypothetical protein
MATIVNNPKYGEGHEVILKSYQQIPKVSLFRFNNFGFKAGEAVFKISRTAKKANYEINLGVGADSIFLVDAKGKIYRVTGKAAIINGSFNHNGNSSKAQTNQLTKIKELVSMWTFEKFFESGKIIEEDEIYTQFSIADREGYKTLYYDSAIKQLDVLKSYVKGRGYTYERQGQDKTKKLYATARKLTRKLNDNWNPADIWMIKNTYDMNRLYNATSANELNGLLGDAVETQDIIPISLKQITTPNAKLSIVDSAKQIDGDVDLDFSLKEIQLTSTLANFFVITKSNFTIRGGFKSSGQTLSVSLEGKMAGAKYQMGAIDARWFSNAIQSDYSYTLRGGVRVSLNDLDKAKREFKEIIGLHGMPSEKIKSYEDAISIIDSSDDLTKKRFVAIVSYLYAITVKPGSEFKNLMQHCYFSAKKISNNASTYILIS